MFQRDSSKSGDGRQECEDNIVDVATKAIIEKFENRKLQSQRDNHLPIIFQDTVFFGKILQNKDIIVPPFSSEEKDAIKKWLLIEDDEIIKDYLVEHELALMEQNITTKFRHRHCCKL